MIASNTVLQKKYERIVKCYADRYRLEPEVALDRFYRSHLYQLISTGVSDLHCMSEGYLAEELSDEWSMSRNYTILFDGIIDHQAVVRFISENSLDLSIRKIAFFDDRNDRIGDEHNSVIAVLLQDAVCEKRIDLPDQQAVKVIQFIVTDKTNQEQHLVSIHLDGKMEFQRMIYVVTGVVR